MLKRLFVLLVVCVCNIVVYAADKKQIRRADQPIFVMV